MKRLGFALLACGVAACATPTDANDTGFVSAGETSTTGAGETTSTDTGETTTETSTDTGESTEESTDTGETTTGGDEGPQVLVMDEMGARGIAVDATHVYWTNQSTGMIQRVPIAGGDVEILAQDQVDPYAIVVDATHAYWSNQAGDAIMRVLKEGGTPEMIDNAYDPTGIAVDSTHVYWISTIGVHRAPKEGGNDEQLATNEAKLGGIALTTSHVYWTDHGGWDYVPGDTGGMDNDPYWEGRIMRVAKGGGSAQVVSGAQDYPYGIDTDSQYVYWVNNTTEYNNFEEIDKVKRAPLAGGEDLDLATMQDAPWSIVVLGEWVYFATKTQVWRTPTAGGPPDLLADMQYLPRYLAVDNAHLFWANGDGSIMKLAFE